MASLQAALDASRDNYQSEITTAKPFVPAERLPAPSGDQQPFYNAMIRCPLPPVSVTPDSLRQFFTGGKVPQVRLLSPPNTNQGSGINGTTTINQTTIVQSTSSGSGGGSTVNLAPKTATLTTNVLAPGAKFTGVASVSKSFQLLSLSSTTACRVELYGTASAQSLDISRGVDVAPAAGTIQNLLSDIVLDSNPFSWTFQNRIGCNGDVPQKTAIYVTITNMSSTATAITVSYAYLPLES